MLRLFHRMLPKRFIRWYRSGRAWMAQAMNGFPQKKLVIVGVTGTDGKTTVVNLVGHIVRTTGKEVGWISTLGAQIGDTFIETGAHTTTVDPFMFYSLLRRMVQEHCELVVVELTSHALDQERVGKLPLATGIITNITHEHLDYHQNLMAYLHAKAKLFSMIARGKRAHKGSGMVVLNGEDATFPQLSHLARAYHGLKVFTFGLGSGDVHGERIEETLEYLTFTLVTAYGYHTMRTRLIGDYNLKNILGAAALAHICGVTWEKIHEGIETFQPLSGRLERIDQGQPFNVFVDFAHTPNALREVLTLLRRHAKAKVIVVCGAAGERDASKRPVMGEVVATLADYAYLTEEDPRSESVEAIAQMIAQGMAKKDWKQNERYWIIPDRRAAIQAALSRAHTGDIVLLAGKGHERMMAMDHGVDAPWDDREAAREELEKLGWRPL
ncbi:MAG: UDP-N-acetylmuramoyl-L-alanyl-D-glutamate--2,6-diaminopimelate ligase [Patescibacteria group bacterium]